MPPRKDSASTIPPYRCTPRQKSPRCSSVCGKSRAAAHSPSARNSPCARTDRKSTHLNSSHSYISYAVFCLKKKKKKKKIQQYFHYYKTNTKGSISSTTIRLHMSTH